MKTHSEEIMLVQSDFLLLIKMEDELHYYRLLS